MAALDHDIDWRLRHLRKAAGLSISELADAAGCSYRHVQMIETTARRRPSPELATRIADALATNLGRPVDVVEFYDPPKTNWVAA